MKSTTPITGDKEAALRRARREQRRAHHGPYGCMSTMSSLDCPACNQGIPYPGITVDELVDEIAESRRGR